VCSCCLIICLRLVMARARRSLSRKAGEGETQVYRGRELNE